MTQQHMQTYHRIPLAHLAQLLAPLGNLFLDCDGKTQLVSTVLSLSHLIYQCCRGTVFYQDTLIAPHYWIEFITDANQRWIIDYALHQWIIHPQHTIPDGLFNPLNFPYLVYQGKEVTPLVLPKPLFVATQFDPRHTATLPYAPLPRC
jgi:hypothetical protein